MWFRNILGKKNDVRNTVLMGSGLTAIGSLYTFAESNRITQNEKKTPITMLESAERLRKKMIVASAYDAMGVPLASDQIDISYQKNLKVPLFFRGVFSTKLSVVLPTDMQHGNLHVEAALVAASARQAAHDKAHHHLINHMLSGATAGILYRFCRIGSHQSIILASISYAVMFHCLKHQSNCRAEKLVVNTFPDYAEDMIELIKKEEKNPVRSERRRSNILDSRVLQNVTYNREYAAILRWLSLHRRRFDLVKPEAQHPHPLTRAYQEHGLHLNKQQLAALKRLSHSARIYLSDEVEAILKAFFESHQNQNTPLGQLYRTMHFTDFINRLITKTFKSVYLDGRVLYGRPHQAHRLINALPGYPNADAKDNLALLQKIGGLQDTEEVFKDYLTLEEIGIKSLLIAQAVCLPIGDGRRDTTFTEDHSPPHSFQIPVIESLAAAKKQPVVVASISGIEARNGHTIHPDLFIIFAPKTPNHLWKNMVNSLKKSSYYQVSKQIYGDKLAIDYEAKSLAEDKDFVLFGDGEYEQAWYVCTPAYKKRMKLLYRNLLTAADKQMKAYDLGHTFHLKGLGLGYFGFGAATPLLEMLSKEALSETLAEIKLNHIQQINLINWPSQLNQMDAEKPLHQQTALHQIACIGSIRLYEGIAEPFSVMDEAAKDLGGTHACADAASQFGNEVHIGMPPSSSDEAATYYALLDPTLLIPDMHDELPLRLKR